MSVAFDRFDSADFTAISTRLAKWYDAQSSIRRLWAVQEEALIVYLSLEPTADGGDTLPVWLAMSGGWRNDLESIMSREVQLRLVASGELAPSHNNDNAVVIAEVDWRDSWINA
jgi:hypothetical protein